jgi:hypothetical protein
MVAEDTLQMRNDGKARHVFEDHRFLGQQPRDHQRQRRIFRTRNLNVAIQLVAADNANAIHAKSRDCAVGKYRVNEATAKALKFVAI